LRVIVVPPEEPRDVVFLRPSVGSTRVKKEEAAAREVRVSFTERGYPYLGFGYRKYRPRYRIWLSHRLLRWRVEPNIWGEPEKVAYVKFPIKDATIKRSFKGTPVLKPSRGSCVFLVMVEVYGAGNFSEVEITSDFNDAIAVEDYKSDGATVKMLIVSAPLCPLKFRWVRFGAKGKTWGVGVANPFSGRITIQEEGYGSYAELVKERRRD